MVRDGASCRRVKEGGMRGVRDGAGCKHIKEGGMGGHAGPQVESPTSLVYPGTTELKALRKSKVWGGPNLHRPGALRTSPSLSPSPRRRNAAKCKVKQDGDVMHVVCAPKYGVYDAFEQSSVKFGHCSPFPLLPSFGRCCWS